MREDFRLAYTQELRELRRLGDKFAKSYPKAASNLRLNQGENEDPGVSRLLESVAFLNARLKEKIASSQDKLVEDLFFSTLAPLTAPAPAFTIAKLTPHPFLEALEHIPKHSAFLSAISSSTKKPVKFRSVYPIDILPIEVKKTSFSEGPFTSKVKATGLLEIDLKTTNGAPMGSIPIETLNFFFDFPDQDTNNLIEMILNHSAGFSVKSNQGEFFLNRKEINPVGFNPKDTVLPYDGRISPSLHILREFFLYPQKHHFIKFGQQEFGSKSFKEVFSNCDSDRITLRVYCKHSFRGIKETLNSGRIHLNCTPLVNLFEHQFEPIALNKFRTEHHINADLRHYASTEVYSVDQVNLAFNDGKSERWEHLFKPNRINFSQEHESGYLLSRESAIETLEGQSSGSEVFIRLSGLPKSSSEAVIECSGLATNRDLANRMSDEYGGKPPLYLKAENSMVQEISSVTSWTGPKWSYFSKSSREQKKWMGIMQLNLDYFSREDGIEVLKSLLANFCMEPKIKDIDLLNSIHHLTAKRGNERIWHGNISSRALGTEFTLNHNKPKYSGTAIVMLCRIIEQIFADHCTPNTFIKLRCHSSVDEEFLLDSDVLVGCKQLA